MRQRLLADSRIKYAGKLNDVMRESLIEWLNSGDSNRRILARISAERRAGVLYDGLTWPDFNSGDAACGHHGSFARPMPCSPVMAPFHAMI